MLICCSLGTASFPWSLQAEGPKNAPQQIVLSEEDLLLCVFQLGGSTLSADLATYVSPKGVFLPLGEINRLLEFGITVDPAGSRASGSLARPSQFFLLDMRESKVTVSGKAYRYDPLLVVSLQDDIYVESKLLGEWLSMQIKANRFNAVVDLRPFELLPLQQRMARSERGANTWGYGSYNDPGYPLVKSPYRFLGGPSIDLFLSSMLTGDKSHDITLSDSRYYTRASGDILWMNGLLDVSGQIAGKGKSMFGVDNGSLILQRADPNGGMLGPLHARTVAFGDFQPSPLPLIGGKVGSGVMISSYPLAQSSFFDKLTLSGFLANGWDVELYRNGSLLDFRQSNPEERYSFADIPLVYGMNELKLIFYGPRGERRVETHNSNVGSNMLRPGELNYQITAADASRPLLFSARTGSPEPSMTWKSTVGVSRWLTASNYLATSTVDGERQSYAGAGFSGYMNLMQLDLQMAENLVTGSWARQAGVQSLFDPLSLLFVVQDYDNNWKSSDVTISFRRKWNMRLDGIHPFPFFSSSRLSMEYIKTEYDEVRSSNMIQLASLNRTLGISHTHNIALERIQGGESSGDVLTGSSYASLMRRNFSLRADLGYRLMPDKSISTAGISAERRFPHEWMLVNSIAYAPPTRILTASLGINRSSGAVALGATGNYKTDGTWSAGIQLSTNLSREPQAGRWIADGSLNCQQAAVSAMAFLDMNHNKKQDPGEALLDDVGFAVNQQNSWKKSGLNGVAFLQGLSPNVPTDISISASTLKELQWIPAEKGLRVVPRPGYPVSVQIPVWVTGEVSGKAYRSKNGTPAPASGITIEAVDKSGQVVAKTRSEFDGVYILAALPAGECTVRISPEQAVKLRSSAPSRVVDIPPEGGYIDNVDLVLEDSPAGVQG